MLDDNIKKDDLKCCGNCESTYLLQGRVRCSKKGYVLFRDYCDQWRFDSLDKKDRTERL
jgi:hypothetical protein